MGVSQNLKVRAQFRYKNGKKLKCPNNYMIKHKL